VGEGITPIRNRDANVASLIGLLPRGKFPCFRIFSEFFLEIFVEKIYHWYAPQREYYDSLPLVLKYLIFEVFLSRTLYDCEADSDSRLSKFYCNKFCGAGILPCWSYQWLNCRWGQWLHRARHKSKSSSVNFKHGWQEFTAIFECSRLCQYPLSRVKGMPIYSRRLLVQWNILRCGEFCILEQIW